ncbi:related to Minor histocompatibility antigen H13 [Ustilago trichophora]|uniref:Related to Minor histocompatibility antigen H13 n=1 Tax=Ustilago trichophora TaxID=86804 RepID=A0A5C3E4A5_9BASI|nr:related to Minor histocompatibility antigen H13 [Ustilago trichophora]
MSGDRDLFIAYGVLMAGAVAPIYFGSFSSLKTPKTTRDILKAAKKKRKSGDDSHDSDSETDSDSDDDDDVLDRVTSSDAMWFPIMGSAVLFGLFLIFKYLNKKYVNLLLSFYFGFVGCLALSQALVSISRGIVGRELWKKLPSFRVQLDQRGQGRLFKFSFTTVDVALFAVSALLVGVYLVTKNWIISNLLALSLSLNAIALMSLDSFRTGAIMLGGLFVYDIFWVFATPVMVSVARNFDAPIKIVWPKNILEALWALQAGDQLPKLQFTMLGLGDIVIPGIFVALALRYDQLVASEAKPSASFTKSYTRFNKPYFKATLAAYVAGLATTMGVMHFFKAAQPALLYLSPACTGAVFLTAALRGEFKQIWNWTDGEEEDKEEGKKKEKTANGVKGESKTSKPATRRSSRKSSSSKKD